MPSSATQQSLVERLRAYIPVEGQEGIKARDALMREAADEIVRLKRRLAEFAHEQREAMLDAATEARWQERQGEDYGSY